MDTNRIKQIFIENANKLAELRSCQAPMEPGPLNQSFILRNGIVFYGEVANFYQEMLEKICKIATKNGSWSKQSVDDVLMGCLGPVIEADVTQRKNVIQKQGQILFNKFNQDLIHWKVDISVNGFAQDCAGLLFGKIHLLRDIVNSEIDIPDVISAGVDVPMLFARLGVEAIDKNSAIERAMGILEEHLAVQNALFSRSVPSMTRLTCKAKAIRESWVSRAEQNGQVGSGMSFHTRNPAAILLRQDYEELYRTRGGERLSMLLVDRTSFGDHLLSAYATAGAACLENRNALSFLLFAIALESVVLGRDTTSEIGFQLSVRVAHLLTEDMDTRRKVVKRIKYLYKLRSGIVHEGNDEITDAELSDLKFLCHSVLYVLTVFPNFQKMSTREELDDWFNNRLLESAQVQQSN